MAYANCQASDFFHPRYAELALMIRHRPNLHRQQWEWIYILHKLMESGALRKDARGLVFGVGVEPLPALFASMGIFVTATDAPPGSEGNEGWVATSQYGHSVDALLQPEIASDEVVRRLVEHRVCDMTLR